MDTDYTGRHSLSLGTGETADARFQRSCLELEVASFTGIRACKWLSTVSKKKKKEKTRVKVVFPFRGRREERRRRGKKKEKAEKRSCFAHRRNKAGKMVWELLMELKYRVFRYRVLAMESKINTQISKIRDLKRFDCCFVCFLVDVYCGCTGTGRIGTNYSLLRWKFI